MTRHACISTSAPTELCRQQCLLVEKWRRFAPHTGTAVGLHKGGSVLIAGGVYDSLSLPGGPVQTGLKKPGTCSTPTCVRQHCNISNAGKSSLLVERCG